MVRNHDHSFREITKQASIDELQQLSSNTLITTDSHNSWCPALRDGHGEETEGLLGEGDPGIVPVLVDEVQRGSKDLGCNDSRLAV